MTTENLLDAEIINALREALATTRTHAETVTVPGQPLRAALERLIELSATSSGTTTLHEHEPVDRLWAGAEIMAEKRSDGTGEVLLKVRLRLKNVWGSDQQPRPIEETTPWYTLGISIASQFSNEFAGALKQVKAWTQQSQRKH